MRKWSLTRALHAAPDAVEFSGGFSVVRGMLGFVIGAANAFGLNANMLLKGSSRKSVNVASPCVHAGQQQTTQQATSVSGLGAILYA